MTRLSSFKNPVRCLGFVLAMLLAATTSFGQTTSFTYQGRIADGGTVANGNYDLQFGLWTSVSGGSQVGTTQSNNAVAVNNGVFTVSLDFGANAFPGASRFLEIALRPAGVGSLTVLSPRQPITSTPYAIRSLNAVSADSVPAAGVPSGSGNYIQNSDSPLAQATSNFNISGSGSADILQANQFFIRGDRVLSVNGETASDSLFVGVGTGQNQIVTGGNVFVGQRAAFANVTGVENTFVGNNAGANNSTGNSNVFVGNGVAFANLKGSRNAFFGNGAGGLNTTGNRNTLLGDSAGVGSNNLTNATAIGAQAEVDANNALVLGSINGINNAAADTRVGIGLTAPVFKLHVVDSANTGLRVQTNGGGGTVASFGGNGDFQIDAVNIVGGRFLVKENGQVGIGTNAPLRLLHVNGRARIGSIPIESSTGSVCFNALGDLLQCGASSLRLKKNVSSYHAGLDVVRRLRPISFNWKEDGLADIGLAAEEVSQVAPSFTYTDVNDEVVGVKYDRLNILFINAIKEQQQQIEKQQKQIAALQTTNADLGMRLRTVEKRLRKKRPLRRTHKSIKP